VSYFWWPLLLKQARGSEVNIERESPAPAVRLSNHSSQTSLSFLQHLLGDYRPRDFAVRSERAAVDAGGLVCLMAMGEPHYGGRSSTL
jgi:hypothetical protein